MHAHGSVTVWLERLKDGSAGEAVDRLWHGYFRRLVELARGRLRARPRGIADEEDVALTAFDSFVRAVQAGRFPRLNDRNDLWQVLLMLTARKAADLSEREGAAKRGGGAVVPLSALQTDDGPGVDRASDEPTPDEAAAMAEGFDELLAALPSDELRRIAVWKLEGYSNAEIATLADVAVATVERKLKRIREALTEAGLAPA